LKIQFPQEDFPFKPPRVTFQTPIYHPNIDMDGNICADIFGNGWSPAFALYGVVVSIYGLLDDPDPYDPLDAEIAQIYLSDRDAFNRNAREWTVCHAMGILD
jgi:ubiquitin-protein ligase